MLSVTSPSRSIKILFHCPQMLLCHTISVCLAICLVLSREVFNRFVATIDDPLWSPLPPLWCIPSVNVSCHLSLVAFHEMSQWMHNHSSSSLLNNDFVCRFCLALTLSCVFFYGEVIQSPVFIINDLGWPIVISMFYFCNAPM